MLLSLHSGGVGDALYRYGSIQYDPRERFGMAGVILNSPRPMWQGPRGGPDLAPPAASGDIRQVGGELHPSVRASPYDHNEYIYVFGEDC